jgi:ubiquinone/menaquinone biosynthesis C-methylase UbiE
MIEQAQSKRTARNLEYRVGAAEAVPLRDGCADLVFMSMAFHHFTDTHAAARECYRVLRPGGRVCIRNGTQESDFPHRHYFPGLSALIESDLPSRRDIETTFVACDFALASHQVVVQVTAPNWQRFVESLLCAPTHSWLGFPTMISCPEWPHF